MKQKQLLQRPDMGLFPLFHYSVSKIRSMCNRSAHSAQRNCAKFWERYTCWLIHYVKEHRKSVMAVVTCSQWNTTSNTGTFQGDGAIPFQRSSVGHAPSLIANDVTFSSYDYSCSDVLFRRITLRAI